MCRTHKIADQLEVKLLNLVQGASVLPLPEGPLEDRTYLVDKDGTKMILKTGHFADNEIENLKWFKGLGIEVPKILQAEEGEYILEEYFDAPMFTKVDYWSDENMKRIFAFNNMVREKLSVRPAGAQDKENFLKWVSGKVAIDGGWLAPCVPVAISEEKAREIRQAFSDHQSLYEDVVLVYFDNNADHYIDLGEEVGVIDIDLSYRVRPYMNMRYLAWVLLNAPREEIGDVGAWLTKWTVFDNAGPPHYATLLVSLVGIMWDIYGNLGSRWSDSKEKTGDINQAIDWTLNQLKESNEVKNG
jgi:hypothetical protein